jgi:putative acetyltransferase
VKELKASFNSRPTAMQIRSFREGDAPVLRAVFYSSVHELARQHYRREQLNAWAPRAYDAAQWAERLRGNQPFIAEIGGRIAGFADLQASGYIDHFFVAGAFAGQGAARALMAQIHDAAARRGITELFANVSLTAESFFAKNGFVVEARQRSELRGVVLANARMRKTLPAGCS